MADLPFMQFFPADWLADTRMLTASAKGVWIDTLADLWSAPERGLRTASEREWARLWGVEPERVPDLVGELQKVAGIRREKSGNEYRVTICSRRIIREELERERSRNSKRPDDRKDWTFRNQMVVKAPELFPPDSRNVPADFPEVSRRIPGDIPETRDQSKDRENNNACAGIRRPSLAEVKSAAPGIGVTPEKADEWWHTREASAWMKGTAGGGTTPVGTNWQADLKIYASRIGFDVPKSSDRRRTKSAGEYPEPPRRPLPRA